MSLVSKHQKHLQYNLTLYHMDNLNIKSQDQDKIQTNIYRSNGSCGKDMMVGLGRKIGHGGCKEGCVNVIEGVEAGVRCKGGDGETCPLVRSPFPAFHPLTSLLTHNAKKLKRQKEGDFCGH